MNTTVEKPKTLRLGSWRLYISQNWGNTWRDLWGIEWAKFTVTKSISEIVADNQKYPPEERVEEAVLSANLFEFKLEDIALLNSNNTLEEVSWEKIDLREVVLLEKDEIWKAWTFLNLSDRNADNTRISFEATSFKNWTTQISEDKYEVIFEDWITKIYNKSWGDIKALTSGIKISYSNTPAKEKKIIFNDSKGDLKLNSFKFVNTDSRGNELAVQIYAGYNTAWIDASFASNYSQNESLKLPISIKAFASQGERLFEISDKQDV